MPKPHPMNRFFDTLTKPSPNIEWLLTVGPIAKGLNQQSPRENERERNHGL